MYSISSARKSPRPDGHSPAASSTSSKSVPTAADGMLLMSMISPPSANLSMSNKTSHKVTPPGQPTKKLKKKSSAVSVSSSHPRHNQNDISTLEADAAVENADSTDNELSLVAPKYKLNELSSTQKHGTSARQSILDEPVQGSNSNNTMITSLEPKGTSSSSSSLRPPATTKKAPTLPHRSRLTKMGKSQESESSNNEEKSSSGTDDDEEDDNDSDASFSSGSGSESESEEEDNDDDDDESNSDESSSRRRQRRRSAHVSSRKSTQVQRNTSILSNGGNDGYFSNLPFVKKTSSSHRQATQKETKAERKEKKASVSSSFSSRPSSKVRISSAKIPHAKPLSLAIPATAEEKAAEKRARAELRAVRHQERMEQKARQAAEALERVLIKEEEKGPSGATTYSVNASKAVLTACGVPARIISTLLLLSSSSSVAAAAAKGSNTTHLNFRTGGGEAAMQAALKREDDMEGARRLRSILHVLGVIDTESSASTVARKARMKNTKSNKQQQEGFVLHSRNVYDSSDDSSVSSSSTSENEETQMIEDGHVVSSSSSSSSSSAASSSTATTPALSAVALRGMAEARERLMRTVNTAVEPYDLDMNGSPEQVIRSALERRLFDAKQTTRATLEARQSVNLKIARAQDKKSRGIALSAEEEHFLWLAKKQIKEDRRKAQKIKSTNGNNAYNDEEDYEYDFNGTTQKTNDDDEDDENIEVVAEDVSTATARADEGFGDVELRKLMPITQLMTHNGISADVLGDPKAVAAAMADADKVLTRRITADAPCTLGAFIRLLACAAPLAQEILENDDENTADDKDTAHDNNDDDAVRRKNESSSAAASLSLSTFVRASEKIFGKSAVEEMADDSNRKLAKSQNTVGNLGGSNSSSSSSNKNKSNKLSTSTSTSGTGNTQHANTQPLCMQDMIEDDEEEEDDDETETTQQQQQPTERVNVLRTLEEAIAAASAPLCTPFGYWLSHRSQSRFALAFDKHHHRNNTGEKNDDGSITEYSPAEYATLPLSERKLLWTSYEAGLADSDKIAARRASIGDLVARVGILVDGVAATTSSPSSSAELKHPQQQLEKAYQAAQYTFTARLPVPPLAAAEAYNRSLVLHGERAAAALAVLDEAESVAGSRRRGSSAMSGAETDASYWTTDAESESVGGARSISRSRSSARRSRNNDNEYDEVENDLEDDSRSNTKSPAVGSKRGRTLVFTQESSSSSATSNAQQKMDDEPDNQELKKQTEIVKRMLEQRMGAVKALRSVIPGFKTRLRIGAYTINGSVSTGARRVIVADVVSPTIQFTWTPSARAGDPAKFMNSSSTNIGAGGAGGGGGKQQLQQQQQQQQHGARFSSARNTSNSNSTSTGTTSFPSKSSTAVLPRGPVTNAAALAASLRTNAASSTSTTSRLASSSSTSTSTTHQALGAFKLAAKVSPNWDPLQPFSADAVDTCPGTITVSWTIRIRSIPASEFAYFEGTANRPIERMNEAGLMLINDKHKLAQKKKQARQLQQKQKREQMQKRNNKKQKKTEGSKKKGGRSGARSDDGKEEEEEEEEEDDDEDEDEEDDDSDSVARDTTMLAKAAKQKSQLHSSIVGTAKEVTAAAATSKKLNKPQYTSTKNGYHDCSQLGAVWVSHSQQNEMRALADIFDSVGHDDAFGDGSLSLKLSPIPISHRSRGSGAGGGSSSASPSSAAVASKENTQRLNASVTSKPSSSSFSQESILPRAPSASIVHKAIVSMPSGKSNSASTTVASTSTSRIHTSLAELKPANPKVVSASSSSSSVSASLSTLAKKPRINVATSAFTSTETVQDIQVDDVFEFDAAPADVLSPTTTTNISTVVVGASKKQISSSTTTTSSSSSTMLDPDERARAGALLTKKLLTKEQRGDFAAVKEAARMAHSIMNPKRISLSSVLAGNS